MGMVEGHYTLTHAICPTQPSYVVCHRARLHPYSTVPHCARGQGSSSCLYCYLMLSPGYVMLLAWGVYRRIEEKHRHPCWTLGMPIDTSPHRTEKTLADRALRVGQLAQVYMACYCCCCCCIAATGGKNRAPIEQGCSTRNARWQQQLER